MVPEKRKSRWWLWVLLGLLALLIVAALVITIVLIVRRSGQGDGDSLFLDADFTPRLVTDEASARLAVSDVAKELGIRDPAAELGACRTDKVLDSNFFRFEQTCEGYTVYGRCIIVAADADGQTQALSSNYQYPRHADLEMRLETEDLAPYIREQVGDDAAWQIDIEPVIYTFGEGEPQLAWPVMVWGEDTCEYYFFSAVDGNVLGRQAVDGFTETTGTGEDIDKQRRTFNTIQDESGKYYLYDNARRISVADAKGGTIKREFTAACYSKNNGYYDFVTSGDDRMILSRDGELFCVHGENGRIFDFTIYDAQTGNAVDEWDPTWAAMRINGDRLFHPCCHKDEVTSETDSWNNEMAVTLMTNVAACWDFFHELFGRRGYDGRDGYVVAFCNVLDGISPKAFSCGYPTGFMSTNRLLVFNKQVTVTPDVVGHEYMHAVTATTANLGADSQQGGILNEAYSDVFGQLILDYCDNGTMDGSCSWIMAERDPTITRNIIKATSGLTHCPTKFEHKFDGQHDQYYYMFIITHAAYRMSIGINQTAASLDALTTEQIAKLFYQSIFLMTPTSGLDDCGSALWRSAQILREAHQISEAQMNTVQRALEMANILPQSEADREALEDTGLLTGMLTGNEEDDVEVSVTAHADGEETGIHAGRDGEFALELDPGEYSLTAKHGDDVLLALDFTLEAGQKLNVTTLLPRAPWYPRWPVVNADTLSDRDKHEIWMLLGFGSYGEWERCGDHVCSPIALRPKNGQALAQWTSTDLRGDEDIRCTYRYDENGTLRGEYFEDAYGTRFVEYDTFGVPVREDDWYPTYDKYGRISAIYVRDENGRYALDETDAYDDYTLRTESVFYEAGEAGETSVYEYTRNEDGYLSGEKRYMTDYPSGTRRLFSEITYEYEPYVGLAESHCRQMFGNETAELDVSYIREEQVREGTLNGDLLGAFAYDSLWNCVYAKWQVRGSVLDSLEETGTLPEKLGYAETRTTFLGYAPLCRVTEFGRGLSWEDEEELYFYNAQGQLERHVLTRYNELYGTEESREDTYFYAPLEQLQFTPAPAPAADEIAPAPAPLPGDAEDGLSDEDALRRLTGRLCNAFNTMDVGGVMACLDPAITDDLQMWLDLANGISEQTTGETLAVDADTLYEMFTLYFRGLPDNPVRNGELYLDITLSDIAFYGDDDADAVAEFNLTVGGETYTTEGVILFIREGGQWYMRSQLWENS